ncbi:polymorphic toxin type 44 domain-containing protein [Pseudomonas sp. Pseusp16]
MISHGKAMAGTLDSHSGCPCKAQLIPSVFTASYRNKASPARQATSAAGSPTTQADSGFTTKSGVADPKLAEKVTAPLGNLDGGGACNHPDQMEELAAYIAGEMNRNITHASVLKMKELNSYNPEAETSKYMEIPFYLRLGRQPNFHSIALAKKAEAFALWAERVGQNRSWDHKPKIKANFGGDVRHKQGRYDYFYDIWSNIHYGYVGMAAGFSERVLLDGAGAEQIISDAVRKLQDWENRPGPNRSEDIKGLRAWDDIPDRKSIAIGVSLFRIYSTEGVSAKIIMDEVLAGDPADWGKGISVHKCE